MQPYLRSWQLRSLWIALGIGVALAGCADAPPTPTSMLPLATQAVQEVVQVLAPTSTREATVPLPPTWTPTSFQTPPPMPSLTNTPILTPSPTPEPSAQLEAALRYQTNGDYEQAIAAYQTLLDDDPTPSQARQAHYHLAESYLLNREYAAAAAAWEVFLTGYRDDDRLPQATLMAARAYDAANECAKAISHYQAYLAEEDILAELVYEWIGDCHAEEGRVKEALAAYQQGLAAAKGREGESHLREKVAGVYLVLEEYDSALEEYQAILDIARIDYYRAKIEYLAGQALAATGQTEAAYARYRQAVDRYPEAGSAYLSLIELVDAGMEVDEFQRGLVDYYAGAAYPDAYGAAIRAFDRYLAAEPAEKADQALYYKALALRALDQPQAALEVLEALITGYPQSEQLARAWLEKGATLVRVGESDAAVKAYQDLAAFFPAHKLAPEALWRAAKLREGEGAYVESARLYEGLQTSFPAFENAEEALWRAGLAHFRAGDQERAIGDWQSLLAKYPASPYRARSLYWLGKLKVRGGPDEEDDYWTQLVAAEPQSYYALRVEQIRASDSLTATRLITAPIEPPPWDTAQAEAEILTWLRGWTQVATGTVRLTVPVTVANGVDFRQGEALLAAGLRREALETFDRVRAAAWKEPVTLAQLSLFFHERGLHGLAARSAYRLAGLRPEGNIHEAPLALQQLAYPLVYADLLSVEAGSRGLDPLLLAALVRQESLFEPVAESYAGARGLGQVMPATGQGIANSLGLGEFVLDDLYRPSISIRFGAFYLAVQMGRFDDQILVALAAYNGGPGNTLRWLESTGSDDLDLFVEVITSDQSRLYLQRVYEQYLIYEKLYRTGGSHEQ